MMLWRVTNLLSTSVSIEDLGITLQARGGEDSSATISDESRNASRSLKNLVGARWVSLSPYNSGSQKMPIWPFSKTPPVADPPTDPAPAPVPVARPPTVAPDPGMLETMRRLESTLAELAAAIRSNPSPTPMQTPSLPSSHAIAPVSHPSEPMFIPESIMPKDAKSEIHVKKDESSADTLESSASALKKLRKAK